MSNEMGGWNLGGQHRAPAFDAAGGHGQRAAARAHQVRAHVARRVLRLRRTCQLRRMAGFRTKVCAICIVRYDLASEVPGRTLRSIFGRATEGGVIRGGKGTTPALRPPSPLCV